MKFQLSLLSLLLFCQLISLGQKYPLDKIDWSKVRKNEIVVKVSNDGIPFSQNSSPKRFSVLSKPTFSKSIKALPHKTSRSTSCLDGIYFIELKEGEDMLEVLQSFQKYDNVIYAEPLFFDEALLIPNDPLAQTSGGSQYYLNNIQAYDAWEISRGNSDIIIGISDTGIDFDHEDISPKIYTNSNEIINGVDDDNNGFIDDINGYDFANDDNDPQCTTSYHGNFVAGLAGAATNNEIGISSVGYDCSISGLKVFPDGGNLASAAYEGIIYAADNDYDVINLSWGSTSTFGQFRQDVIDYAVLENDLVIVAAGGNSGLEEDFYPASYDHILSVGWTDINDIRSPSSTFSYKIDLVAPGVGITSTLGENGYHTDSGSSFAAPLVAGAAALVRDVYPQLNAQQVMEVIRTTTDDIYDVGTNIDYEGKLGSGRLNVFKALSQDTLRSIRMTDISYSATYDNYIFFDDSLSLEAELTSYLLPLKSGNISFSSPSPYVNVGEENLTISYSDSMQTRTVSFDDIYISPNTPPASIIPIKLDFAEGSYNDFQYFTFKTSPDYINLDNANMNLTIAGNGSLAYPTSNFNSGVGLNRQGQNIIESLSIIIGNDPDSVSDNTPTQFGSLSRDGDFITEEYIKLHETNNANHFAKSSFSDIRSDHSLGLKIEQKAFSFDEEALLDFIILEYRVTNLKNDTIRNLSVGMMVDWQLNNSDNNKALLDKSSGITYGFETETSIYSGIKWYGIDNPISQSIDIDMLNGNTQDIQSELTDSVKYQLIHEHLFDSAGFEGISGNNIAQTSAVPAIKLAPYASKKMTMIISAANSFENLKSNINLAEITYENIVNNPPTNESLISCNGSFLEISPASGTNFRFFKDPLGESLISQGDTLVTGVINSDTSFYFQNIDSLYASDIEKIEVSLVEKVAQFNMSVDTLYLDHPTVNFVSFFDNSYEPESWSWDFSNGSSASLQNPKINFTNTGQYQISLAVETAQGCLDTAIKTLVVAERPNLPVIEDINVCTNQSFSIADNNSDTIIVFSSLESETRLFKGKILELTVVNDTILYVSRIENGFASKRKEVKVNIQVPQTDFHIIPNIETEASSILLVNNATQQQTLEWTVDNTLIGFGDSLNFEVQKESYQVKLIATTTNGCVDSLTQTISFQTSPTPEISIENPCLNDPVTLSPTNGKVFAFYSDNALSDFISKGSELTIENLDQDTTIYIVGLDSILPSNPLIVNLSPEIFEFKIVADQEVLDLSKNKNMQFSTSSPKSHVSWNWLVNGKQVSALNEIEIFFQESGFQEIICKGTNENECNYSDTLLLEVVDEVIIPLSLKTENEVKIYPNPTSGQFSLSGIPEEAKITVSDISGKVFFQQVGCKSPCSLYVQNMKSGLYLVKVETETISTFRHLILR